MKIHSSGAGAMLTKTKRPASRAISFYKCSTALVTITLTCYLWAPSTGDHLFTCGAFSRPPHHFPFHTFEALSLVIYRLLMHSYFTSSSLTFKTTFNAYGLFLVTAIGGRPKPRGESKPERRSGKRIIAGAFRLEFLVCWYYDVDATMAVPELF